MEWLDRLLALFRGSSREEVEPIGLNASSEAALAASLRQLASGERGWITIQAARRLFSSMDENDDQALSSRDQEGNRRLGEFAADRSHRSTARRQGDRVFFTRN